MVCSDRDVYPNFTLDIDLSSDVGGRVVTTLLRLARRVYREYQRALWDADELEDLNKKEEEVRSERRGPRREERSDVLRRCNMRQRFDASLLYLSTNPPLRLALLVAAVLRDIDV